MSSTTDQVLEGRVAVVSPHLDDAALSLGASIARSRAAGNEVTIVTVLAGDSESADEPGAWDRTAGFKTAGEAASARAEEDDRACSILGARPVRLSFWDRQYARGEGRDEVLEALAAAVESSNVVLVPGYPLRNEDHVWLAELIVERGLGNSRLAFYTEQPYAAWTDEAPQSIIGPPRPWVSLKAAATDQFVKLRACRAYKSQIGLLGGTRTLLGILAYESRHGGESISWIDG